MLSLLRLRAKFGKYVSYLTVIDLKSPDDSKQTCKMLTIGVCDEIIYTVRHGKSKQPGSLRY